MYLCTCNASICVCMYVHVCMYVCMYKYTHTYIYYANMYYWACGRIVCHKEAGKRKTDLHVQEMIIDVTTCTGNRTTFHDSCKTVKNPYISCNFIYRIYTLNMIASVDSKE